MHCPKGGNVRTFLTSVRNKREELASVGVTITHWDYQRTVLKGIPEELAEFAAQLLTSARVNHSPAVDTDTLINAICEESNRVKNCHGSSAPSQKGGGGKKDGVDEALVATGPES